MRLLTSLIAITLVALLLPAAALAKVEPPQLNQKAYDAIVAGALARVPVHNPEWTNFNEEDPPPILQRDRDLPVMGALITLSPGHFERIDECQYCEF